VLTFLASFGVSFFNQAAFSVSSPEPELVLGKRFVRQTRKKTPKVQKSLIQNYLVGIILASFGVFGGSFFNQAAFSVSSRRSQSLFWGKDSSAKHAKKRQRFRSQRFRIIL